MEFEGAKELIKQIIDETDNYSDVLYVILFLSLLDYPMFESRFIKLLESNPELKERIKNCKSATANSYPQTNSITSS